MIRKRKIREISQRDWEIHRRWYNGEKAKDIASDYEISNTRVYWILNRCDLYLYRKQLEKNSVDYI